MSAEEETKAEAPPEEEKAEEKEEEPAEEAAEEKKEEKKPETPKKKAPPKKKEAEEEEDDDEEDGDTGNYWNVETGAKRQRKNLEHFHIEVSKKEDVVVQKGSGKPLGDIDACVNLINSHTISKSDPKDPLKILSKLLFNGRTGTPKEIRDNLFAFSGMVFADQKAEENFKARIQKKKMAELKEIMGCIGLDRGGKQDELCQRLFDFLKKPSKDKATGRAPPGKSKTAVAKKKSAPKAKKSGGKKASKKSAPKKRSKPADDDDDDDDDDDSEEEEEPPKKKAKSAPKKKPADDDEDEEMDEPLVKPKGGDFLKKLKGHIEEICGAADLSSLTLRMVREKLADKFDVDTTKYKDEIRNLVDEYVENHQE